MLPARSPEVALGQDGLYLKIETGNPSGSFKDRGSALVVTAASRGGYPSIAVASTGNVATSNAAYASRFGLRLTVIVPSSCEDGNLCLIASRGGEIMRVQGGFLEAERQYGLLVAKGWFPAGSDNPLRTEGTKTLAYEIHEQMQHIGLDRVIVPVGTGSLIAAVHKGFAEVVASGRTDALPAIDGVQISSVAPLTRQVAGTLYDPAPSPASGINIQRAVMASEAVEAIEESGGTLHIVRDDEVLAAQRDLARYEGVGAEPTGAVSVAAFRRAVRSGLIDRSERVVAVITGSLKSGIM
jgi:threonine synthase